MISSSQRPHPDNTQHSQQKNIHAPGGIRTHSLSMRAAANLRLRPAIEAQYEQINKIQHITKTTPSVFCRQQFVSVPYPAVLHRGYHGNAVDFGCFVSHLPIFITQSTANKWSVNLLSSRRKTVRPNSCESRRDISTAYECY